MKEKCSTKEKNRMSKIRSISTVEVNAGVKWQRTGVYSSENEKIVVIYRSGKWSVSPKVRNVDGNGSSSYMAKTGYAMPGKPEGSLIGRIGDKTFYLGNKGETPAGAAGELELCANDDLDGKYGKGFRDNSGSISVELELELV